MGEVVGKELKVIASKNANQVTGDSHADDPHLCFTKDEESIVFAGKPYTLNGAQRNWVKNKINEEIGNNCSITVSLSPTSGITGDSKSITVTITLKYKGVVSDTVEGQEITGITCSSGSTQINLTKNSVGVYKGSISTTGNISVRASAVMFGITKTHQANYSTYYPSYYGKISTNTVTAGTANTLKSSLTLVTKNITGSTNPYSVNNANQWLWIVVPKTSKEPVVKDTETGYGVAMEKRGDFFITPGQTSVEYTFFRSVSGVSSLKAISVSFS